MTSRTLTPLAPAVPTSGEAIDAAGLVARHGSILRTALLIRRVEETLLELFSRGLLNGTVHTCIGQELIGPCVAESLAHDDFVVSSHRGHGHYLARTGDVAGLIAELMGRTSGAAGGVGGSQHLIHHHYLSNGIQGGMTPVAAGVALANQLQANNAIAVAFIGDGTLGQGVVYETFNLAGIWKLPVLFVLENNRYAQSTSMAQSFAGDVATRVRGFGLQHFAADTWNLDQLRSTAAEAVAAARNQRPCVLEVGAYRLMSHSKGDDNRRDEEIAAYWRRDLLAGLLASDNPTVRRWQSEVEAEVAAAVRRAEAAPVLQAAPRPPSVDARVIFKPSPLAEDSKTRVSELIYQSYRDLLPGDATAVVLGEDVEFTTPWTPKPYGGAFKATRDLSELFPGRVRNTPISEAAVVGVGTGLALGGMKPTVEIMFGDFLTLAFDQLLNHACKFCDMYGRAVNVPLVVRTPMGGRRGYGPTHSQSLERHFLGIPNLSIVALNRRVSPRELYAAVHRAATHPVLVIENKVLYTHPLASDGIAGFECQRSDEAFPTLRITPRGGVAPDVTIACYGGMLDEVETALGRALDELELVGEVLCPTRIHPLNIEPFVESVSRTGRLLIVEEGGSFAAWGSEIAARLAERGVALQWFRRLGCDGTIPCSLAAELSVLPSADDMIVLLRELVGEC